MVLSLQHGANVWTTNRDENHLPLHAALERGHVQICKVILQSMEINVETSAMKNDERKINLKEMTFSLLQKAICNSVPIEKRPDGVDHADCLDSLLNSRATSGTKTIPEATSVLELVKNCQDFEIRRLIEEEQKLRFNVKSPGKLSTAVYLIWKTFVAPM